MDKRVKRFRELFCENIADRLMQRFEKGEIDPGIQLFLEGKPVAINIQTIFDGRMLTEHTKDMIIKMPKKKAKEVFSKTIIERINPAQMLKNEQGTAQEKKEDGEENASRV